MSKYPKTIIVIIILALVAGFAIFKFSKPKSDKVSQGLTFVKNSAKSEQESEWLFWADAEGRFAFSYPPEFSIKNFEESGGEMLLAESPDGKSFQIFISLFEGDEAITAAMIKKNLPDLKMENSQEISIAGVPAVAFFSEGPAVGGASEAKKTREAWFIKDGLLYQATAFAEMDELFSRIMKTFELQ